MNDSKLLLDQKYYTKKNKPRQIIECYSCRIKTMHLVRVDRTFISGDLHVYVCSKCDRIYKKIL